MHAFSLKDFEFKLPPDVWDAAQDLHAAGAVRKLSEVEPKFWLAEVATADFHVEVEVLFAATKVKGFTCECRPGPARPRCCPHVAATLITLRHFYEKERREREKPAIKAESGSKKLTTANILAQVAPERLADFIREYAQNDREFALALKTRFAAELPGTADFFGQLLDAVIQPCRSPKCRDHDFRQLMSTLGDLEKQQSAAFGDDNFTTVFQVGGNVLRKLAPLAPSLSGARAQHVEKFMLAALRRLSAVGLRPNIAPGLGGEVHRFFVEILEKDLVLPAMEADLLDFFVEKSARKGQFDDVEKLILARPDGPLFLFKLAATCFPRLEKTDFLLKTMVDRDSFEEIQETVLLLFDRSEWATAKEICLFYLEKKQPRPHEAAILSDFLFEVAGKLGDKNSQAEHLQAQFLATSNFSFFEKLKTAAAKNWPKTLETVLFALRNQPQTGATRRRIAKILAAEGQTPVLAAYLEAEGDPDILALHVDYFLKYAPAPFFRLVKRLLADHLREHFGRQPAEKTREFLANLNRKSPTATTEIAKEILGEFWERQSLVEEIGIFLTKEERAQLFDRISARLKTAQHG